MSRLTFRSQHGATATVAIKTGYLSKKDGDTGDIMIDLQSNVHFYQDKYAARKPPTGFVSDHKDGNGLNNQKSNLRICTNAENIRNAKRYSTNTTGFKGVCIDSDYKKLSFRAGIKHYNKTYKLGNFNNAIDAAKAYDKKARELYGEFAKTNFTEVPE